MTSRPSTAGNGASNLAYIPPSGSSGGTAGTRRHGAAHDKGVDNFSVAPKNPSFSTSWNSTGSGLQSCVDHSRAPEAAPAASTSARRGVTVEDHFDFELRQIDSTSAMAVDNTEIHLTQHNQGS